MSKPQNYLFCKKNHFLSKQQNYLFRQNHKIMFFYQNSEISFFFCQNQIKSRFWGKHDYLVLWDRDLLFWWENMILRFVWDFDGKYDFTVLMEFFFCCLNMKMSFCSLNRKIWFSRFCEKIWVSNSDRKIWFYGFDEKEICG